MRRIYEVLEGENIYMNFTLKEGREKGHVYLSDNAAMLKKMCLPMLTRFGGISEMDYDDFISIAAQTVWETTQSYNKSSGIAFDNYLASCILRKIKTEISRRNRQKRTMIIEVEDEYTGEIKKEYVRPIVIDFTDEADINKIACMPQFICQKDILEEIDLGSNKNEVEFNSPKLEEYMKTLSKREKKVLKLLALGEKPLEIQIKLRINNKQYNESIKNIRSYERIQILF